jgi:TrkA domain protein
MSEVTETQLPGVGVRFEFTTESGERVGVLARRSGRRELLVFDREDPDASRTVMHLGDEDARILAEMLGATHLSEAVTAVQQRIESLSIEWITLPERSSLVGATIGDGQLRTRTGASIVAVVRGESTTPAPGPEFRFEASDVAVAIGTTEGLAKLRGLLEQ